MVFFLFLDLDKFDFRLLLPKISMLSTLISIRADTLEDLIVFNIEIKDAAILLKP